MSDFIDSTGHLHGEYPAHNRGLSDNGSSVVNGPPRDSRVPPPSPNYVTGPEYPPLPEFVPKPVYPEFMPPDDDVLPAEEQLLPTVEDDDEDLEEDLADYPTDKDDDDEEEDDPFGDEAGDEEEEEHLALADFIAVPFPAVDHVPSVEETEPFKTDESVATPPPHPTYRVTARMSVRAQKPMSLPSDTEVARLLAIPTPPPSPLSLWSSPLPQIPLLPLPEKSRYYPSEVETPSTSHPLPSSIPPSGIPPLLPIPLPTPSPPLLLSSIVCRAGTSEVTLPPRKRLCIALGLRYNIGDSSFIPTAKPTGGFRADYGFVSTLYDEIRRDPERYVGYGITDTWKDMINTQIRYMGDWTMHRMSGRLNMLHRDRHAHDCTALLMEREARLSHEAWGRSMDDSDTACSEVRALRTTILAQQTEIAALRAADRA
ncbi:hypothetical protein Tco_0013249 [Tanacetum coccineum]